MQYLGLQHLQLFQSTPPARGATSLARAIHSWTLHFNPRPPRGGATVLSDRLSYMLVISIHAPREGGDVKHFFGISGHFVISIHAPREGGDAVAPSLPSPSKRPFQSTPPARGATSLHLLTPRVATDFNPRPPRGGRLAVSSIWWATMRFQSTPPARGATPSNSAQLPRTP